MSNKVLKPSIIAQRQQAKNLLWNWVAVINNKLASEPIKLDNSIDIVLSTKLDTGMITDLVEIFTDAEWDVLELADIPSDGNYPVYTVLNFSEA